MKRRWLFALLGVGALLLVNEARAEDAAGAFERGRTLLGDGKIKEACAAFELSQRLAPDASTLLHLGNCYQRDGRAASAWQTFRQAITLAHDLGQPDRERYARERAAALEPDLSYLTITIAPATASLSGLAVTRDGVPVSHFGATPPTAVDSGRHTVTAKAPGKKDWSSIVDVGKNSASNAAAIEIPVLEDADPTTTLPTPVAEEPQPQPPPPASSSSLFVAGLIAGGAGLVVTGIGTGFALSAQQKEDDLETLSASRGTWSPQYQKTYDDGSSAATTATVLFVTGGLLLAVGVTLAIVNAPASSSSKKQASLSWPTF